MAHDTTSLNETYSAYVFARGKAQGTSTHSLRRQVKRLARRREAPAVVLARLKAIRHELAERT